MCAIWGHRTLPHTDSEGGNMNCALVSLVSNMYKSMQTKVDLCSVEAIPIHMRAIIYRGTGHWLIQKEKINMSFVQGLQSSCRYLIYCFQRRLS